MSKSIKDLASIINKEGGKAYLIGGAVIDKILGNPVKDYDIEVYGLSIDKIESILQNLDLPVNNVGKSFGVIKTTMEEGEIDISLPRKENKRGKGHKGFKIIVEANLTPKEAAQRRDLTINSMSIDILTEIIIDPFNGYEDLMNRCLKHINAKTFQEDPLRVLRIMQLLPRKGAYVDINTITLCRKMFHTFQELPKERIFEEFKKLLLKSDRPSMGLQFLRDCDWIYHFPVLSNLIGCRQNLDHHPEGDVWNHTLMVIDNAAKMRDNLPEEDRLVYMFAALLHDVGKPITTDRVTLTAYGHDDAGASICKEFLYQMTNEVQLIDRVSNLVKLHMIPGHITRSDAGPSAWRRLHNKVDLNILGYLCKADSAGRTGRSLLEEHLPSENCFKYKEEFPERILPVITGKDLIDIGLSPGPIFGSILKKAYEMQLDGQNREEILEKYIHSKTLLNY